MLCSEEVRRPLQRPITFLLTGDVQHVNHIGVRARGQCLGCVLCHPAAEGYSPYAAETFGEASHHGEVQRHQLYRQFGFADADGELGSRRKRTQNSTPSVPPGVEALKSGRNRVRKVKIRSACDSAP